MSAILTMTKTTNISSQPGHLRMMNRVCNRTAAHSHDRISNNLSYWFLKFKRHGSHTRKGITRAKTEGRVFKVGIGSFRLSYLPSRSKTEAIARRDSQMLKQSQQTTTKAISSVEERTVIGIRLYQECHIVCPPILQSDERPFVASQRGWPGLYKERITHGPVQVVPSVSSSAVRCMVSSRYRHARPEVNE